MPITQNLVDAIAADTPLLDTIRDVTITSCRESVLEYDPDCACNHIGTAAYLRKVKGLTKQLRPLGLRRADNRGHVRWFNADRHGEPFQLITSKAEWNGETYTVSRKGPLTEAYIAGQLSLFEEEFPNDFTCANFWIIVDLGIDKWVPVNPSIRIDIVPVLGLMDNNTRLRVDTANIINIYTGPLFDETPDLTEPQQTEAEVVVEDIEE